MYCFPGARMGLLQVVADSRDGRPGDNAEAEGKKRPETAAMGKGEHNRRMAWYGIDDECTIAAGQERYMM